MSDKKTTTCPLKSNFAFAIIAILSVGLLLYTTIEVYNCKQDINQINNEIQKISVIEKNENNKESKNSESNSTEVDQKLINSDNAENTDVDKTGSEEIVYNEDGSIDTSNWETYKSDILGIEFKYPKEKFNITENFNNSASLGNIIIAMKGVSMENVSIYLSFEDSYGPKDGFAIKKFEDFKNPIKIKFGKNLEGEMISYELEDIGKIHRWKEVTNYAPLRFKTVSKKIDAEDYKKSEYKNYLDFISKKCGNISFMLYFKKYPVKYNVDKMILNCHSNDRRDGEILLNIFNSFRVYERMEKK